jgi:hypothetical protein
MTDTSDFLNMVTDQDSSASDISDAIKTILFNKASEKIEAIRPSVYDSVFSNSEIDTEKEEEV